MSRFQLSPATPGERVLGVVGLAAAVLVAPYALVGVIVGFSAFNLIALGLGLATVWALLLTLRWCLPRLMPGTGIRVGLDGLVVRRPPLFRRRFVPHARIVAVDGLEGLLRIELDDGSDVRIRTVSLDAAVDVEEAVRAKADAASLAPCPAMPVHAGGLEDYRAHGFPVEGLIDVLDHPLSRPTDRLMAAQALAHIDEPDTRQWVQMSAQACVQEPMRRALVRVVDDGELDEQALVEAEAAFDGSSSAPSPRRA